MTATKAWRSSEVASRAVAALAIAIQIHTTLPIGQIGVRVSLADIILPFVFIVAFAAAIRCWPLPLSALSRWHITLLALASVWLLVAIIRGRIELGYWEEWALVNRGLGWLVALAFFAVGWAGARVGVANGDRQIVKGYLIFFWLSCLVSVVVMLVLSARWLDLAPISEPKAGLLEQTLGFVTGTSRFQGFAVNPNAFGLLAVTAILLQAPYAQSGQLFSPAMHSLGLGISLFGLIWSLSRGAWLGAAVAVAFLCVVGRGSYKALLGGIAIALAASFVLWLSVPSPPRPAESKIVEELLVFRGSVPSIDHRRTVVSRTLSLWMESPIEGVGAGVFLGRQTPSPEDPLATIHSTYLWLLAETGIIGIAIFGVFFALAFVTLIWSRRDPLAGNIVVAVAALMAGFGAAALTMDVMYQRHLWLFLGFALGFVARSQSLASPTR